MIKDREVNWLSGWLVAGVMLLVTGWAVKWALPMINEGVPLYIFGIALVGFGELLSLNGVFTVQPNESKVFLLFGHYVGTVRKNGLRWTVPIFSRQAVSMRLRNFESNRIKVNDSRGNPVEVAAIAVWRVADAAQALFEVDSYVDYVHTQTESALRTLATKYPYDAHDSDATSLSGHTDEVSEQLKVEIQERLKRAGVEVIEARLSHLAYAPEIASAMLQRQQADAVIAARRKIVDGAVGMVEHALSSFAEKGIVKLSEDRKASVASNLLVVLCSDRHAQPVLNTGSE